MFDQIKHLHISISSIRYGYFVCTIFLTLAVDNFLAQNEFLVMRTTIDPIRELEISSCRVSCGDAFYMCAMVTCKDDNTKCQKMCITDFRACFHVCKIRLPYADPIPVVPPDAFLLKNRNQLLS